MSKVIVIGAGAAGMMAAIAAAECGHSVTVLEKNEKAGKKIFITGKGRCNITNGCDVEDLFNNMVTNKKFMYSAFYSFTNSDVVDFFNSNGLVTKVERGERVFPESDKSNDVIVTLTKKMRELGIKVMYSTPVKEILTKNISGKEVFNGVVTDDGIMKADSVIIATGGLSYQSTGSTGDGLKFAKELGHNVTDTSPALVPFNSPDEDVKSLSGLALKDVGVTVLDGNKKVYEDFGELLFTHFGLSGPTILSASSFVAKKIKKNPLKVVIDLKPALSSEQLDERILRDFEKFINKNFNNSLDELLPKSLIPVIIERTGIDEYKKVNEVSKDERKRLVDVIKAFTVNVDSLRGYNEAIITQGGVDVKTVDPSTMESKIVENVYFAGEVLDLDAVTGGFNLQIAWSTGHLAGMSIK